MEGAAMQIDIPDELFGEEELTNTPDRIRRFLKEWESNDKFKFTTFINPGYDQVVILKDIDFASVCSHHLLPFIGKANIGYIPSDKLCGISKLARVVNKYASRPQIQERLTQQIADFIEDQLNPIGVIVVLKAQHQCMTIRGVRKPNSVMITSALKGLFKEDGKARAEFMSLIQ